MFFSDGSDNEEWLLDSCICMHFSYARIHSQSLLEITCLIMKIIQPFIKQQSEIGR